MEDCIRIKTSNGNLTVIADRDINFPKVSIYLGEKLLFEVKNNNETSNVIISSNIEGLESTK